ncbi:mucin-2-like [Cololabis saira]|uniref:mucin-2-like n=1 Tax=Cololabis saira TaxID=129043 RepID=UPI002AD41C6D|nr:mucin-2-like [Cololabis saira]
MKHYQDHKPDQDKTMIKKTESKKSPNPVQSPTAQKPQTVNTTLSDEYPSINGESESDDVRITDQNSKKDKKLAQTRKTDHPKHKQTPEKKILSEEKTKLHLFEVNKNSEPVQEPESTKGGAASFTPKPNQKHFTQSVEKPKENTSLETKSNPDSTPGHKTTSDGADATPDQELKSSQEILTTEQTPNPSQKNLTVSVNTLHESKSNTDSTTRPKIASDGDNATPDQKTESNQEILATDPTPKSNQKTEFNRSETAKPNQKHLTESLDKSNENPSHQPKSNEDSVSRQIPAPDRVSTPPAQKPEPTLSVPKINQTPKLGQVPKPSQRHPKPSTSKDLKSKLHTNLKPGQKPQTNPSLKISKPGQRPALKPISVTERFPKAKPNKTSKAMPHSGYVQPTRPTVKPQGKPIQRPKPAEQPKIKLKTQTHPDPPHISRTTSHNIQNSHTDNPSASGLVKQSAEVTHSPTKDFRVSMRETITLGPKTFNSLETGLLPRLHTLPEDFMLSPNSRIISDLRPHTDGQPPSIPTTASPNKINHGILHSVITSTSPGSTQPRLVPKSDPGLQNNVEDTRPATQVPRPRSKTTSTLSPELRSETPTPSSPEPPAAEPSTSSARELRVKINQVAAFLNNTLIPNGRPVDMHLREHPRDTDRGSRPERTDSNLPTSVAAQVRRDCSDHLLRGETKSGVYLVTPDPRSRSFQVFCDMELQGGGWTLLQRRMDGSVSFNRTWAEYQSGFGRLHGGEFWLGNDRIHLLTRDRDMVLRVELEDFSGTAEHAQYQPFRVAGERLRYRLTVGAYSGTAGDALRFSRSYDHNHRAFTTPDRDNDRYPSGNCGAYYSSGWWFDACMAANLNGRYYKGTYKGVRDGIFWGTWHNISTEYYPTNDRQSFKTVRMMIRPKGFAP